MMLMSLIRVKIILLSFGGLTRTSFWYHNLNR